MGRNNTPARLRTVRCIATGELLTQSSSKTKRLLKLGGYVEVRPDDWRDQRTPQRRWRAIGIGAAVTLSVLATLVWLRLVSFI